ILKKTIFFTLSQPYRYTVTAKPCLTGEQQWLRCPAATPTSAPAHDDKARKDRNSPPHCGTRLFHAGIASSLEARGSLSYRSDAGHSLRAPVLHRGPGPRA